MGTETETWFLGEVLHWRTIGGISWSLLLSMVTTAILTAIMLALQMPTDPISVIITTLRVLLSPSSWFYLLLASACVLQLGRLFVVNGKATPSVTKSVLSCAKYALTEHILHFAQFVAFGGFFPFILVKLMGNNLSLVVVNEDKERWLNPGLVCLMLAGGFAGLREGVDYYFGNGNFLQIPIINLDKYSQVTGQLTALKYPTIIKSFQSFRYFYIMFCILSWLTGYITAHDAFQIMLSPSHVVLVYVCIHYVHVINTCIKICMVVHCTRPLYPLSLDNLLDGSASEDSNLLSLLSLQDLANLTSTSADARREIYSLSIPGGHPTTWNRLLSVTLKQVQNMNADLGKLLSPPSKEEKSEEETQTPSRPSYHNSFARNLTSPNNMRLLAPSRTDEQQKVKVNQAPAPPKWVENLTAKWNNFVAGLNRRPVIGWLVNEPQDIAFRNIFSKSQTVIYAAEILSYVVRASITEDKYGVVQKDLPSILTNLLRLEEAVDRCRGQANIHRKRRADPADVQLKLELKCALKSAVYRIVIAFKEHILEVPMPSDLAKKITNCHNFVEA